MLFISIGFLVLRFYCFIGLDFDSNVIELVFLFLFCNCFYVCFFSVLISLLELLLMPLTPSLHRIHFIGRHKTRQHIGELVKETSAKLKQASETDHYEEVSVSAHFLL